MSIYAKGIKRVIDIIVSGLLLVVLSPLLLALSIAIKVDSSGDIFYKQIRVGRNKSRFQIYKFRSMVDNANELGGVSTQENDVRITKIGQILRRFSLDELPQLINVFKGEMSLIGPRPDVFQHLNLFTDEHLEKRLRVRPGITGLSQVNGRSSISLENRILFDEKYVDEISFGMDLKILLITVYKVIRIKGVN